MSLLPPLAALALAFAAVLSALSHAPGRGRLGALARALAGLGALALLPSAAGGGRPAFALAAFAAAWPWPLALLLASGGAARAWLDGGAAWLEAPVAIVGVALAAAAAAAAVSSSLLSRLRGGADPAGPAAVAGGLLALLLGLGAGGRVPHWSYLLGTGPAALALPGAGLLLGLTLLCSLGGASVLGARALAGPAPAGRELSRRLGQRALLLAVGFGILGAGLVVVKGLSAGEETLASGARATVGLLGALGLLVLALVPLLLGAADGEAAALEASARTATRLGALLALLAVPVAGVEGWMREASYATPVLAGSFAAALLGLAALEPTGLATLRRAAFLAGLVFLLAR